MDHPRLVEADRLAGEGDLAGALAALDAYDAEHASLPPDDLARLRGRLARASAHQRLLSLDEAVRIGGELLAAVDRPGHELLPGVLVLLAGCAMRQRQLDRVEMLGHRALDLLRGRGEPGGVARALALLGGAAAHRGELGRARKLLSEAVVEARAAGDRGGEARALNQLGFAEYEDGRVEEARAALTSAVALAQEAKLPLVEAAGLEGLGYLALEVGDAEEGERRLAQTAALGSPDRPTLLAGRANALALRGDVHGAEQMLRRALEQGHPSAAGGLGWRIGLAGVLLPQGRLAEAQEELAVAMQLALEHGIRGRIGAAATLWMEVAARRGRAADWQRGYRWAKAAWREVGDVGVELLTPASHAGRAWALSADPDAPAMAARSHQLALAYARKMGRPGPIAGEVTALEALAGRAPIPLGDFDLLEELGRGGFGVVWRARRRSDGALAAVKVLTAEGARKPRRRAVFEAEVRTMMRVEHPSVARVWDYGLADEAAELLSRGGLPAGSPFYAMELAGGTLDAWRGGLPWKTGRRVLLGILRGLACAHARDVLHRDLKPANVLTVATDPADGVLLADFGLAELITEDEPQLLHAGTPAFMAPEQFEGRWRDCGPWTDLFAVGRVAETLLTASAAAPAAFAEWVARAIARDPRRRWRHAADAAEALEALPEGEDDTPATRSLRASPQPTFDLDDLPAPLHAPPPAPTQVPTRRSPPSAASTELPSGRPPQLLARDDELARLSAALERAVAERGPVVVVVHGAPGSGRSLLARRFVETAVEAGRATALAADGEERVAERLLRTRKLSGRFLGERLDQELDALGFAGDERLGLVHALSSPVDAVTRQRAVWRVLAASAAERPVIVVADDGRGLVDFASLVLGVGAREPAPVVLLLVATDDLSDALPGSTPVRVGPLPDWAIDQLLGERLGVGRIARHEVARRAGGSPQLLEVLVQDWRQRGLLVEGPDGLALRPGVVPDLPAGIEEAWSSRVGSFLEGQRPEAARALELLAVLGGSAPLAAWAAACAEQATALGEDVVDRWLRAGVLERSGDQVRFAVALFGVTLFERARASGRLVEHHRACAVALGATGDPAERGRHLVGAGSASEGAWLLLAGAARAATRGAPAEVLGLLDLRSRAIDAEDGPDTRAEVGLLRARARWELGQIEEAELRIRGVLRDEPAPRLEDRALELLVELLTERGAAAEAVPFAARRVARAEGPDRVALARMQLARALWCAGRAGEALADLGRAAVQATAPAVRTEALARQARLAAQIGSPDAEEIAAEAVASASDDWSAADAQIALGDAARHRDPHAAEACYARAERHLLPSGRQRLVELPRAVLGVAHGSLASSAAVFAAAAAQAQRAARARTAADLQLAWLAAGASSAGPVAWSDALERVRVSLELGVGELDVTFVLAWGIRRARDPERRAALEDLAERVRRFRAG